MNDMGGYYDLRGADAGLSALRGLSQGEIFPRRDRTDAVLFAGAAIVCSRFGVGVKLSPTMPLTFGEIAVAVDGTGAEVAQVCREVAESYRQMGEACVSSLRGGFVLALYDAAKHRLLLARDALGRKPLYCMGDGARLWFSSHIQGLWKVAGDDGDYLAKSIWEPLPGECLLISRQGICRCFGGR